MQELQQQEQDITGAHSVRGQVALPGTSRDEYCNKIVHEESQRHAVMRRADRVSRGFRELGRGPGSFFRDLWHEASAFRTWDPTTIILILMISVCLNLHCKASDLYYH